ncbi:conserved hypothetical protein [Histoplasma capsulatum G186AR]|uniref:Major facilitator superfamily (MFS) profile domain-containing protein n=2 Tax=Ajellomyces capsulatus TaxID=5037 RepID=C0NTN1_AJECG|nr:uncharacterized protein HCBG_06511 [Histoplasma capsulatum G186AR]EEH05392.1 conserved hypothetical protein [Histoplasma capsulatum G186AR]KAG5305238.1 high-affinity nicotinic acid transporter [Histoplasma capsulatum]QSS76199.1 high-affinity nicotinic acid transporter [Histoplasma capsulatum G186AR]
MTSSIHESSTEKGRIIDNKNVDSGQLEDGVRETTKQLEITPELARIERNLVRRQDWVIMPQVAGLYLLAYLDRSNLGNARLLGLEDDALNGNDDHFGWAASVFYFGFVLFAIPLTLVGKTFNPSKFVFACALGWGTAASAAAGANQFWGVAVARFFTGLCEAGFAPTIVFYLTIWYTRDEVAFRTALLVGMAALSGAFSGLISYAISLINTNIGRWRILFLIEGLPTVVFAFIALLFLPDRPETSKFLRNEEERNVSIMRMHRGQKSEGPRVLVKKHVISAFKDWKIYACALSKMGHDAALALITVFLPTIVKSLGFTPQQAQYLTIGPYMTGWAMMLIVSLLSDRTKMRGPFLIGCGMFSIIGATLLFTHPAESNRKVALSGIFILLAGVFPCVPLQVQWASDNCGAESKKTTAISMLLVAGHCWSILVSKSFPTNEGPRFIRGYSIVLSFLCLSVILPTILHVRHRIVNARRDRKYGIPNANDPVDTSELADHAPMFRYVL